MSITPNEILEMEFSAKLRGYNPGEVRSYLETVAKEFAIIIKERNLLKDHIIKMKGQIDDFKQKNEEFRLALTTAHNISKEMKKQASKEAELILEKARLDAEKIIGEAHNDAIRLDERVRHLRHLHRDTILKIRSQYESLLEMLEEETRQKTEAHPKFDFFAEKKSKLIHENTSPIEIKPDEPFHLQPEDEKGLAKEDQPNIELNPEPDSSLNLIASEINTLEEDINLDFKAMQTDKDFFSFKEEMDITKKK